MYRATHYQSHPPVGDLTACPTDGIRECLPGDPDGARRAVHRALLAQLREQEARAAQVERARLERDAVLIWADLVQREAS